MRTLELIEILYRQQQLDEAQFLQARQILAPPNWSLWLWRMALMIGSCLFLTGIVIFFAYNWASMPVWSKFALLQAGFVICMVAAIWRHPQSLLGQILLFSASIMLGVCLAVFGQIYQTGADSWQLFATWALLIGFWIGASHSSAQWLLQVVITTLAIILYATSHIEPQLIGSVLLCYALCYYALHLRLARGWQFLRQRWLEVLHALMVHLTALLIVVTNLFFNAALFEIGNLLAVASGMLLWWHARYRQSAILQLLAMGNLWLQLWTLCNYLLSKMSAFFEFIILFNMAMSIASIALLYRVSQDLTPGGKRE